MLLLFLVRKLKYTKNLEFVLKNRNYTFLFPYVLGDQKEIRLLKAQCVQNHAWNYNQISRMLWEAPFIVLTKSRRNSNYLRNSYSFIKNNICAHGDVSWVGHPKYRFFLNTGIRYFTVLQLQYRNQYRNWGFY